MTPLRLLLVTLVLGTAGFFAAALATAETTTSTVTVTTGAPTTTTTTGATTTTADEDSDDNPGLAVAVLVFGAAVVAAVLLYVMWAQGKYFGFVRTALSRGLTVPEAVPISAVTTAKAAANVFIKGDAVVVVGGRSEFKAVGPDGKTPVEATWTVPEDAATLESGGQNGHTVEGESVWLTAKQAGVFLLGAEAAGDKADDVSVTAIVAPATTGKVAFVGAGWGTIILAVLIVTIAGVLSLAGELASEAVAALLGALAGYIFLKAAKNDETTSSTTDD